MNFKLIKAGVAALALLAVPFAAKAADVPIKAPYYKGAPAVSYYNWTGFYAGLNAGYGMGKSTWSVLPGTDIKPKGALFGGTVGYNWQSGAIVYGLEGDFDWSGVKGSVTCGIVFTCETSSSWLATFRGRVGYAFDRWLPYVTAGGAYGNVKATSSVRRSQRLGSPRASLAGRSAPVSNMPSSATGPPSSNISTSISAASIRCPLRR